MKAKMLFLHALSPLHVGTGQGVGVIDLPIAREKPTGIPIVPGSSLKGVLRAAVEDENLRKKVFGPDTTAAHEHAGSVQFGDLHLLFLPVRSLRGTFAWVTSPFLLQRFKRDMGWTGTDIKLPEVPEVPQETDCLVPQEPQSVLPLDVDDGKRVVLEDLDLKPASDTTLSEWATALAPQIFPKDENWRKMFKKRLCLVHDNVMRFLVDTALEVTARIRLEEETKTVKKGALWYEEALPAETIMAGPFFIAPVKASEEEVVRTLNQTTRKPLQLGGNATVGRGLCQLTILSEEKS